MRSSVTVSLFLTESSCVSGNGTLLQNFLQFQSSELSVTQQLVVQGLESRSVWRIALRSAQALP
jgi:hypothetical protein